MNKGYIAKIKKIIASLLVVVMVLIIADQAIFVHSHKLADGTIITHSHPFDHSKDSTPIKTHHHSDGAIVLLSHLSLVFPIVFLAFSFLRVAKRVKQPVYIAENYRFILLYLCQGRAPPIS